MVLNKLGYKINLYRDKGGRQIDSLNPNIHSKRAAKSTIHGLSTENEDSHKVLIHVVNNGIYSGLLNCLRWKTDAIKH